MYKENPFVPVQQLEPQIGDLIEIDRGRYRHWVLYSGNGMVLQVTGLTREISVRWARVKITDLHWAAHSCLVRVNNKEEEAKKRCVSSRPSIEVIREVKNSVGAVVPYNLLTNNCEHYVTEWKFGLSWSEQATVWNAVLVGGYISYNYMGYFLRRVKNRTAEYLRSYVRVNEP